MAAVLFADRRDAGKTLADALGLLPFARPVVLALPRGGVPVGFEVARALDAPFDVFLVRKLGVPGYEELAMGAIATGHAIVLNQDVVGELGISQAAVERTVAREEAELWRREAVYRDGRLPIDVSGADVILVDDGLATGATMRAAVEALRSKGPASITVGVPVASREGCEELNQLVDRVVCLFRPEPFHAVGVWYRDFRPIPDEEVPMFLAAAQAHPATGGG